LQAPEAPVPQKTDQRGGSSIPVVLAGVALAVSVVLRLAVYFSGRAMHIDELRVTQNLAERDLVGLVKPLSHDQFVPVGLLWLMDFVTQAFGFSERALLLCSLVAGIAAVAAAGLWVWRSAGPWPAVFALTLLAAAPKLIDRSVEVKHYSSEMLMTGVVMLAGWYTMQQPGRRSDIAFGAAALLAVLFSHASLFILAGVTSVLVVVACSQKQAARVGTLALALAPSAVVFIALYMVNYRQGADSDMLATYWGADFMPAIGSPGFLAWWPKRFVWLISPIGYPYTGIAAVCFMLGLVALVVEQRWRLLAMIAMPIVFTLLAAVLHVYPFSERMVLFLSPLVAAVIGAGLGWLVEAASTRGRRLAAVPVMGLMLVMAWQAPIANPLHSDGRFDLAQITPDLDHTTDPVFIDAVLRYHYAQSQRLGDAPGDWTLLPIVPDEILNQPASSQTQTARQAALPPGAAPERMWVIVPARARFGRERVGRYASTLEPVTQRYADRYQLISRHTAGGVIALHFERLTTHYQEAIP